jgi:hypothetical protein
MNGNSSSNRNMQNTRRLAVLCGLWLLIVALSLIGCASRQQNGAVAEVGPRQICLGDIDKTDAMQAAQDALLDLHFAIEKADPKTGLIRTHPLSGAQFFEFWRKDSVGSFNKKEANFHSIQRTAMLQISTKTEGTCIECEVTTQRLNLPEHEFGSSSRAYALFTKSSASMQRMTLNTEQQAGVAWVDIGKDDPLAANIIERIETKISGIGGKN